MKLSFVTPVLITCCFICLFISSNSQNPAIIFYDSITEDSVVMYFSDSYNFTWKECAENRRYTKVDSLGDFYKSFTDMNANNTVIAKGYYYGGKKNGYFETFFPNGQLKSKGHFKDNIPVGTWNYFYENGKPERELLMSAVDTFLNQFYNEQGVQTVINGNGDFEGPVPTNDRTFRTTITASGKIINGKADGEWKSYFLKNPYCTEQFDKGIFLKGHFKSILEKNKEYSNRSYLKNVFINSYIETLEQLRIAECPVTFSTIIDTSKQKERPKKNTELNLEHFRSYVNDAIGRVIDNDIRNGNYSDYQTGDNFFKISFTVNDKGTPTDFKKLTSWGDQYFSYVSDALFMHAKIPATDRKIYFQLTVTKSESNTIGYRYNFTYE